MGCFFSCCRSSDDGGVSTREMEMQAQKAKKALAICRTMSAPGISTSSGKVSGNGLALAGAAIEQDAAYWEWHISLPPKTHVETILFGVAAKKDRQFYKELDGKVKPEEGTPSQVNGTQWMRRVDVETGDVIGVAVQQSDLPMVQFTQNGEQLHISAINRFRGTVYPAICLPASAEEKDLQVSLVVDEKDFKHMSLGPRFGPLIVARSIV